MGLPEEYIPNLRSHHREDPIPGNHPCVSTCGEIQGRPSLSHPNGVACSQILRGCLEIAQNCGEETARMSHTSACCPCKGDPSTR